MKIKLKNDGHADRKGREPAPRSGLKTKVAAKESAHVHDAEAEVARGKTDHPHHPEPHEPAESEQSMAVSVAELSPMNTNSFKQFSVPCNDNRVPAGCNFAFFLGNDPACSAVDKNELVVNRVAAMTGALKGCTVEASASPTFSATCPWRIGVQAVCVQAHTH